MMSNTPNGTAPDGATVIIVDDSAVSLKVLERALLDLPGVEVKAFKRPEEALDAFRQGPCDLLITDYEMPQMSGLELIQACRAETNGVDVPMMVVTISFDRELRNAALKLGAVDFLNEAHRCRRGEGAGTQHGVARPCSPKTRRPFALAH